jgi:two-component system nitrogen regulation response regulator GlnG
MPLDDLDIQTLDLQTIHKSGDVSQSVVLTIAGHPDMSRVGEVASLGSLSSCWAELSRISTGFSAYGSQLLKPLGDPYLSRRPAVRLKSEHGGVRIERRHADMTISVDGVPLKEPQLLNASRLERGVVLELATRIVLVLHTASAIQYTGPLYSFVGHSDGLNAVRRSIAQVSGLDVPVLVRGETGTGKELVARALHQISPRQGQPFVAINMAAVSRDLAASELFGHIRGAFSGAVSDRIGCFREANRGSLFLDEVGDTPEDVQALLLRALSTRQIRPVGSERTYTVDVRLIAATDADLEASISSGAFKSSLLHRLAGYQINLPSLRARRDDIGRLLAHFIREEGAKLSLSVDLDNDRKKRPWLPSKIVAELVRYDWPGNIRELRNTVRQMVVWGQGMEQLEFHDSFRPRPAASDNQASAPAPVVKPQPASTGSVSITEDALIEALRAANYRRGPAAQRLGIARSTLYALIERSSRIRKISDLTQEQILEAASQHNNHPKSMAASLEVSERGLKLRMSELNLSLSKA